MFFKLIPCSCLQIYKQTVDFSLFKNNVFLIYVISNVLTSMAIGAPFIFLADRALDAGVSLESSKWILSARGITTTVGKVIVRYISDFKGVNRLYLYISILISLGVSTALCPFCDSFPLLMLFGCALGLFLGTYVVIYYSPCSLIKCTVSCNQVRLLNL